jgi:hypothetical protein
MIEKDGSLSEFKILRDIWGYRKGEEAARVLKTVPKMHFRHNREQTYKSTTCLTNCNSNRLITFVKQ